MWRQTILVSRMIYLRVLQVKILLEQVWHTFIQVFFINKILCIGGDDYIEQILIRHKHVTYHALLGNFMKFQVKYDSRIKCILDDNMMLAFKIAQIWPLKYVVGRLQKPLPKYFFGFKISVFINNELFIISRDHNSHSVFKVINISDLC